MCWRPTQEHPDRALARRYRGAAEGVGAAPRDQMASGGSAAEGRDPPPLVRMARGAGWDAADCPSANPPDAPGVDAGTRDVEAPAKKEAG